MTAAQKKTKRETNGRRPAGGGAKRDRKTEAAVATFTEIAAAEGLLDIAYATTDSPFGPLLLARTPTGLVRVGLPSEDADAMLVDLSQRISPRVLESPAALDEERRELDRYFAGKLDRFELPIDWQLSHGFHRRAREGMVAIPYGETRTYTELARGAGNERAVRAAGSACARNPIPLIVPCHRVLRSDGSLGGYAGGLPMKEGLLELEGARRSPK
jgi:methylated-DNA-[protein]-cysteine S-methyltransferase